MAIIRITGMIGEERYHFKVGFEAFAAVETMMVDPAIVNLETDEVINPGRMVLTLLQVCGMEEHPKVNWSQVINSQGPNEWAQAFEIGSKLLEHVITIRESQSSDAQVAEVPELGSDAYMIASGGRAA